MVNPLSWSNHPLASVAQKVSYYRGWLNHLADQVGICAVLLLTDRRLLVWETKVSPGETYVIAGHGNVGDGKQASLVCRYFTGRSVVVRVYWYSPNNVLGRDQCPFLLTGDE
jgi:hypothetical protein